MAVNKVVYGGKTLVDLTGDTVTPGTLAAGATAHDKAGNPIVGELETGGGVTAGDIYPVGSVKIWYDGEDHSAYLGFTWERALAGRFPVGMAPDEPEFAATGQQGGEKTHALSASEIPPEKTGQYIISGGLKDWNVQGHEGLGQPHNNLPPYEVVSFWRRKA